MAFDSMKMMQLGIRFKQFAEDHPRVVAFFNGTKHEFREGAVFEIKLTSPEGKEYVTSMKLNRNDIDTLEMLKNMK